MKTLKLIFQSLFVVANVVVVILFMIAAFSDRVSPDTSLFFPYVGLLFPVLCVLNFCFIIYWLFLREWKFLLIGLCSFIICWGPVKSYFPFHSPVKSLPEENVIKVLTYNVMAFAYKNHTKAEPNKIVEYIAESDADIVCMQEYSEHKSNKYLTRQKIYDALHMYPYHKVVYLSNTKYQTYGIAVYSKYPIQKTRQIKYDSKFNGSAIHEINIKGKKLMLVNNHLESFKLTTEDRSRYSAFITNIGADTFDDLKGAIEQKLGPAFKARAAQAETVAGEVDKLEGDYIVVCGDFNDTPISYVHRTMQGSLTDAFAESGRGVGVSYNQNFFWFRIDNILHSSNMQSLNCTVDRVKYSDHYPMWCYLKLD